MSSSPRPRIAIDARIINTSTGTYVQRLLEHLQDIDPISAYTVFVPSKDRDFWKPRAANFRVATADYANYSFGEQLGYRRALIAGDFDLVHFCMPQQPLGYRGKVVTTFHDLTLLKTVNSDKNPIVFRAKQLVGRAAFRMAARKSARILVPSRFTRDEVVARYPSSADRIAVTYEAAEKESTGQEQLPLPSDDFLLYVGSQSDYKNVRRLARAHQRLLAERPDLWLVLAGRIDVAAQRNREWMKAQGMRNIRYTGFVTTEQRNWLYSNTRAYVFPSLMEGFGLPGLEAMLWDAPVVSSDATCLPEIYGDAAEYFSPTDVVDMAQAIERVIGSEERRAELVRAGGRRVSEFSWRRMAEQTHAEYLRALNS